VAVRPKPREIHVSIRLEEVSPAEAGKAIGVLLRNNLSAQLTACTTERANGTQISRRAESVLRQLLDRPLPFRPARPVAATHRRITLDDVQVSRLAAEWAGGKTREYVAVVPHLFYLPLLRMFMNNIERQAPEVRKRLCFFFDYGPLDGMHEVMRRCYFGERAKVLKYLEKMRLPHIDCGHQLLLENLISLACYIIPARYLVFMDDDYLLRDETTLEKLLEPLRRGYALSGVFVEQVRRIHTCLFAIRPECLRDRLALFDNGENLYGEDLRSTGSITYQLLAKRKKGVFHVADSRDGDPRLGRHLGHCAGELWGDMPVILRAVLPFGTLPKGLGGVKLDVGVLMESLAAAFRVRRQACDYENIPNELRYNAGQDFPAYFEKIYNNYHWLVAQPAAC